MKIAWDLETFPISENDLAPKPVCISICTEDGESTLIAACEKESWDAAIAAILDPANRAIGHNLPYDIACLMNHYPELIPLLMAKIAAGGFSDTMIREKLLFLATDGNLKHGEAPDGGKIPRGYHQADLEKRYLGIDRRSLKEGASDIWRVNYDSLDGVPACQYPPEAYEYAIDDAINCMGIYLMQEQAAGAPMRCDETGNPLPHAYATESLQVAAAVGLYLQTCHGFALDADRVVAARDSLVVAFADDNFPLLLKSGILRPSEPARPYAHSLEKAMAITGNSTDWEAYRADLEAAGVKFTKPKNSSIDTKLRNSVVVETCIKHKIEVPRTGDDEDSNVSFDAEAQEALQGLSPILDEYINRQSIAKLVTTEIPRLIGKGRIHPRYDILKETGRTSSYGPKKGKIESYPSGNIQQIDPRVRECFVAREGWVLCSVDFDALELVSLAQTTYSLFGMSALRDIINSGKDPHANLGANLAYRFDPKFHEACNKAGVQDLYTAFKSLEELDEERYSHWRTFAKPTGLGYPGGLGAETFLTYARVTYGVDIVKMCGGDELRAIEMAKDIKSTWLQTYPEMKAYFDWISSQCVDVEFRTAEGDRYYYTTPCGMIRRNCTFTAAANGKALQSPSAEGAKLAVWNVARECYDPSRESPIFGCRPLAFIHDQIIAEIPEDQWMHERGFEMARVMRESMAMLMPDVKVGAKPVLMRRWHKKAKTVLDSNQRLAIWYPPQAKAS